MSTRTFLRIAHYFAFSIVFKKAKVNEAKKNMYDNVDVNFIVHFIYHKYVSQCENIYRLFTLQYYQL